MANISVPSMSATASPARRARAAQRKSSVAHDRLTVLLLFLPPALLLFTLFVIMPMGEAAWYSLYKWNGYGTPTDFIGLRNFEVLFRNAAFTQALDECVVDPVDPRPAWAV